MYVRICTLLSEEHLEIIPPRMQGSHCIYIFMYTDRGFVFNVPVSGMKLYRTRPLWVRGQDTPRPTRYSSRSNYHLVTECKPYDHLGEGGTSKFLPVLPGRRPSYN